MNEARRCPECQAQFRPEDVTARVCPACLLRLALLLPATADFPEAAVGASAVTPDPVPRQIGPYWILSVLGEGGMGVVYLAEQHEPINRRVALKLVKPGCDSHDVLSRFETERDALAVMDHPNIARVLDAGTGPGGRPYFVMEYVDGIPITDYCERHGLTAVQRLELFLPVCAAIQHAHQKGVIHRDLKPSNILVTTQDGGATPKVIDFGVAKATYAAISDHPFATQVGTLVGTPEYMSPEQANSATRDIDTTTDIYSLGVVFYEVLTGLLPFDARDLRRAGYDEIRRIIREVDPPRPSARLSASRATAGQTTPARTTLSVHERELRGDLDCITMKAMEKDRTRRYPSASEFASDIARYLKGEAVSARAPSLAYRTRKFLRRNKAAVTAASMVLVSLVAGVVLSTTFYIKADKARQNAEEQAYLATISAADGLVSTDRSNEARERLLGASRARRGWEWSYLFARTDASLATLDAHMELPFFDVRSATFAFPADGTRVFFSLGGAVQAWDATTYQSLAAYTIPGGAILAMEPDGSTVLAASENFDRRGEPVRYGPVLELRETSSGRVLRTFAGHQGEVACAALSADGRRAASASVDGEIRIWNVDGAPRAATSPPIHDPGLLAASSGVCTLSFSPDDKILAAVAWDQKRVPLDDEIRLWNVESGTLVMSLRGHGERVAAVAFSPNGRLLASSAADQTVRMWSMPDGRPIAVLRGRDAPRMSRCLAFDRDGRRLVSGNIDSLRVWDVATGRDTMHDGRFVSGLIACGFNADGTRLFAAGAVKSTRAVIRVWDTEAIDGRRAFALPSNVHALAFSNDGTMLAAGTDAGDIVLSDAVSGRPLDVLAGDKKSIDLLVFDPGNSRLASISGGSTARLWDTNSRRLTKTLGPFAEPIEAASFNGTWTLLALGDRTGRVEILDMLSGNSIAHWQGQDHIFALAFDRPGGALVIASGNTRDWPAFHGRLRVWNWHSGEVRDAPTFARDTIAGSIVVSPSDGRIAVGTTQTSTIWDPTLSRAVGTLDAGDALGRSPAIGVHRLLFTTDGSRIFSYPYFLDGTLSVWDASTFRHLLNVRLLERFPFPEHIALSPDARRIAVASGKNVYVLTCVPPYRAPSSMGR